VGVWATGLYAGDFALDLRSMIGAVAKLPFESERMLSVLCEAEPAAANREDDPDHTTFWLVVADQFAKRGIENKRVRETALMIIDSNSDLTMLERLGMRAEDLRKRSKVLKQVRDRIVAPTLRVKPRKVMSKPQQLLMNCGDVFVYPTFRGRCRNPYFVDPNKDKMGTASMPWQLDSWAAMVIIDAGLAFDFLAWYRPLILLSAMKEKPDFATLQKDMIWRLALPGTCPPSHFKRMGFEKIGKIVIDSNKLGECFGELGPGVSAAVGDIAIANQISVAPSDSARQSYTGLSVSNRNKTITGLQRIVKG
jgi:hypothetical protein